MKVGILTYHDTTNYGAVLQAYALQRKINMLGYDSEIIDYKCEAITNRYKIKKMSEVQGLKGKLKHILTVNNEKKRIRDFNIFNKQHQKISNNSYNKNNKNNISKNYDKIFVGSDQVWNLQLSGDDTTYFLDFEKDKNKKYSYAASFGVSEIEDKYNKQMSFLKDFKSLLVREEQGKQIIRNSLNLNSNVVLDPTLLLTKNEWETIINERLVNYKYIFVYLNGTEKYIKDFSRRLSKKTGYKIISLNHSCKIDIGIKNLKSCTPYDFLNYIKNAEYVVTNSFHGLVFSINFEKEFFYGLSNNNNFNSRLENIISKLGLEERKILSDKTIDNIKKIDYKNVNTLLDCEREKSINLLKNALEI